MACNISFSLLFPSQRKWEVYEIIMSLCVTHSYKLLNQEVDFMKFSTEAVSLKVTSTL
jgi:hypothetical protein